MRDVTITLALCAALVGCDGGDGSDAGPTDRDGGPRTDAANVDAGLGDAGTTPPRDASLDAGAPRALVDHPYVEVEGDVGGPDRGFYRFVELLDEDELDWVVDGGHRLIFSYVRLDDFRDAAIDGALLASLEAGLDRARDAGLTVILRFAYNEGPYPDSEPDASRAQVLAHVAQLQPLLRAHGDVIAVVQAGFIGAWGEWHTSTNDLLDDPADRRAILEALLDAIPADRTTQIRYPAYKEEMYAPLTSDTALDGSYAARTGHHNDCFLSSATDVGTYPSGERDRWLDYLDDETAWVPFGGETCAVFEARGACAPAMAEMARLHTSYMNEDYHPDVVEGWRDGGCYDDIAEHLGYRLVARSSRFPEEARPGETIQLEITLDNVGWAAPFNPRAPVVRLGDREAAVDVEVRRWLPGAHTIALTVGLPSDLPPGAQTLRLALPHPTLGSRDEYALPFANEGYADGALSLGTIEITDGPADVTRAALEVTAR